MPTMTPSERESAAALRGMLARLTGPNATRVATIERVGFMRRHLDETDRDIRHGMGPSSVHLVAIAAHALILDREVREGRHE